MNHRRCWENDRGSGPSRGTGMIGAVGARSGAGETAPALSVLCAASIRAARSDSTGASNRSRSGISMPKAPRRRDITRVASSEWPPSSKKWSAAPTRSPGERPSSSVQMPARTSSTGVRGATQPSGPSAESGHSGAGRASLSTAPAAVRGSVFKATKTAGTI